MKTKHFFMAGLLAVIGLSGCGPGQLFGPTKTPIPTITLTPTPTLTLTPTPALCVGMTFFEGAYNILEKNEKRCYFTIKMNHKDVEQYYYDELVQKGYTVDTDITKQEVNYYGKITTYDFISYWAKKEGASAIIILINYDILYNATTSEIYESDYSIVDIQRCDIC
jgi:hypothetical protein